MALAPIKQRIKFACGIGNVKLIDVAHAVGMSPSTLSQRLGTGKFTKEELEDMADAIGCEYFCGFRFDNGKTFSAPTIGQQIKDALEYAGMTIGDLASNMGLTRQATSKRLAIGKLSQKDLESIASYMNCEYISEFRFEDGTVI